MNELQPELAVDWANSTQYSDDGTFTTKAVENGWDYHIRSQIYHQRQRYDLAIADLDEAIRLEDYRQETYFSERADYYAKLGDYDFAIFSLGEAIDCVGLRRLIVQRGYYAYKKGAGELALNDLNKATGLKRARALTFVIRGAVYQEIYHDYQLAFLDYNYALSLCRRYEYGLHSQVKELRQQVLDLLNTPPPNRLL
jgi:tetratricopeptide (TPR) repeat protein